MGVESEGGERKPERKTITLLQTFGPTVRREGGRTGSRDGGRADRRVSELASRRVVKLKDGRMTRDSGEDQWLPPAGAS